MGKGVFTREAGVIKEMESGRTLYFVVKAAGVPGMSV